MSLPAPYYEQGGITIYHGDCREILPLLEPVDLVLTDPPYGLADLWQGGHSHWPLSGANLENVQWDRSTIDGLPELVLPLASDAVIWGGHLYPLPPARGWLIWDKIVREFSSGHCEMAWTTLDQPVRAFNYAHGELASEGKVHPTQKPRPLMRWCLEFFPDAQTILDPFMGSGTTLRAAKDLGRKAIGIEIEEKYCEIAANRLRQEVLL